MTSAYRAAELVPSTSSDLQGSEVNHAEPLVAHQEVRIKLHSVNPFSDSVHSPRGVVRHPWLNAGAKACARRLPGTANKHARVPGAKA